MADLVKRYGPKVIGLATLVGLFMAAGAGINVRA